MSKMKVFSVLFLICVLYIEGLWSIKANLQAKPPAVKQGGSVVLECLYELQGAALYTVKWYRGQHEFYQFTPKDTPQQKVFNVTHIYVDRVYSNETQVTLRNMELSVSGNFSCEVSAESSFSTVVVYTWVDVVSPPASGPDIITEHSNYYPGDILKATCKSPPSKPTVDLEFFINYVNMSLATKHVQKMSNSSLEGAELSIVEHLKDEHFRHGRMILMCIARIPRIYVDSVNKTFNFTSDPKPERITSTNSSGACMKIQLAILIIALLICAVFSSDYDEYYYESQDNNLEDATEKLKHMLLRS